MRRLINTPGIAWPLAGIHPYARVYCAGLLLVAVVTAPTMRTLAVIGAVVVMSAAAARVRFVTCVYGIGPILSLAAGVAALSLVSGMRTSDIDWSAMAGFGARCWLVFVICATVWASVGRSDTAKALEYAKTPALVTALAMFALRWFDLLVSEARGTRTAMLLRGGSGLRAGVRAVPGIASALMTRSYLRAERVADAMECRGYTGRLPSCAEKIRIKQMAPAALLAAALFALWRFAP